MSVNGKTKEVVFETPIENTFVDPMKESHPLYGGSVPFYIFTTSLFDSGFDDRVTEYHFQVFADKDAVINQIGFASFLEFHDSSVSVNDKVKGSIKEALPLKIKAGDKLLISGKIGVKDHKGFYYGNIWDELLVKYTCQNDQYVERFPFRQ